MQVMLEASNPASFWEIARLLGVKEKPHGMLEPPCGESALQIPCVDV
jgi:hypothetical protein